MHASLFSLFIWKPSWLLSRHPSSILISAIAGLSSSDPIITFTFDALLYLKIMAGFFSLYSIAAFIPSLSHLHFPLKYAMLSKIMLGSEKILYSFTFGF